MLQCTCRPTVEYLVQTYRRARKMFQLAMIFFSREEKNSEKNFRAEKSFFRRNKVLFRAEKVAKLFSALLLYVRQQGFGGKMRKKVLQFFPHGTKFCSARKKLFSGGKKICINFPRGIFFWTKGHFEHFPCSPVCCAAVPPVAT